MTPLARECAAEGRLWLRECLSARDLGTFRELTGHARRPGTRIPFSSPLFRALRQASFIRHLKEIWPQLIPVRAVAFAKSGASPWHLPWHQDRVIAVRKRVALPGFSGWSRKSGIWHCEPSSEILARMFFVRVFLDDCTADQGAMEFARGSHRAGVVRAANAAGVASCFPHERESAHAGDILVLPMLTLHRSPAPLAACSRRVIRIDVADFHLPPPLDWAADTERSTGRARGPH